MAVLPFDPMLHEHNPGGSKPISVFAIVEHAFFALDARKPKAGSSAKRYRVNPTDNVVVVRFYAAVQGSYSDFGFRVDT